MLNYTQQKFRLEASGGPDLRLRKRPWTPGPSPLRTAPVLTFCFHSAFLTACNGENTREGLGFDPHFPPRPPMGFAQNRWEIIEGPLSPNTLNNQLLVVVEMYQYLHISTFTPFTGHGLRPLSPDPIHIPQYKSPGLAPDCMFACSGRWCHAMFASYFTQGRSQEFLSVAAGGVRNVPHILHRHDGLAHKTTASRSVHFGLVTISWSNPVVVGPLATSLISSLHLHSQTCANSDQRNATVVDIRRRSHFGGHSPFFTGAKPSIFD